MGVATIEVTEGLRRRLENEFSDVVQIHSASVSGQGFFFMTVSSPLLADNCEGCQEIIVGQSGLRFKPWRDHG